MKIILIVICEKRSDHKSKITFSNKTILGPLMEGPQCRMTILKDGNVACLCRLFSSMSHVEFKK